jgi:hypothetical protein
MSIAQAIQSQIAGMPAGQVFGYEELRGYARAPSAVAKAVSRMVSDNRIERLSNGKFYVPQKGVLGLRKPSDTELIRSVLYKAGRLRGYVTGQALFNRLGLTTQLPRTITVAVEGGRQEKDFGTIRVKMVNTRFPIREQDVKLFQYLDVLREAKSIPDTDINQTLRIMKDKIAALSKPERERLIQLAVDYDAPQVRALLGLLLASAGKDAPFLKDTLNPTTVYKLSLNQRLWPQAENWNIK